jgi:hypothetical protein
VKTVDDSFGRLQTEILRSLSVTSSQLLLVEIVESSRAWDLVNKLVHDTWCSDDSGANSYGDFRVSALGRFLTYCFFTRLGLYIVYGGNSQCFMSSC